MYVKKAYRWVLYGEEPRQLCRAGAKKTKVNNVLCLLKVASSAKSCHSMATTYQLCTKN